MMDTLTPSDWQLQIEQLQDQTGVEEFLTKTLEQTGLSNEELRKRLLELSKRTSQIREKLETQFLSGDDLKKREEAGISLIQLYEVSSRITLEVAFLTKKIVAEMLQSETEKMMTAGT